MAFPVHTFAEQKREMERSLARTTLTQIDKGEISFADGQRIARKILEHIDKIKTEEELLAFVSGLAAEWPIFETLKELARLRMKEAKEVDSQLQHARAGGVS